MTSPTENQVLERFDTRFQTKPNHMWDSLSQFVLDLLGLEVTAPVIIPVKQQFKLPVKIIFQQTLLKVDAPLQSVKVGESKHGEGSPRCLSTPQGLLFKQLESLRAAETVVSVPALDKLLGSLCVEVQPLRLHVRTE